MSEWAYTRIRDLLETSYAGDWGTTPSPGNARILRATDIDSDGRINGQGALRQISPATIQAKRLQPGDIMLEASGGSPEKPVGRVAFFFGEERATSCLTSNFYKTLRPSKNTNARFLHWALLRFYRQPEILQFQQQTTGIINLKFQDYLDACIYTPRSVKEQWLIARILDTLDTQIQKTEALIAKLEKVKEGLLHDLLTRGIDESGQLRPSSEEAPELYKESPLGLIPKPWDTSKLSELILEHNSGLYTPKSNYGRGTPMLGVSSLYSIDVLQNQELRKAPIPSSMLEKYTLQEGDIVYGESSLVLSGIAKTVAVGELGEGKGFEWHTRRIRVNKDTADPRFISAQLSYFYPVRKKIMSVATQTALTGMTTKDFFSVSIVLPHIDEQKIIFIKLDQLEKRVKEERSSLMKVKSLKKGLMDDLLTGRVRVTPLLDQAQATSPA